ncbi:MAG TPA: hypothetical protein VIK07_10460 [Bacteroidales bacterium]
MGNLVVITALILFSGFIVGLVCFFLALFSGVVSGLIRENKFFVNHSIKTIDLVLI